MKAITKITSTKIFANKAFMFVYSAEIGKNWELTQSFEAENGQTWIKSSWNKYVVYKKSNVLLTETEIK